jgi:hypothetical protein
MFFYDYQMEAINKMKNGSILCGPVGSGKSRTALGYYFIKECKGFIDSDCYVSMKQPKDLYVITTAKKRDSKEWELEFIPFLLDNYEINIIVDSWNNIKKYQKIYNAFFIFDEQRVVGNGAWVKSFYKIANKNSWILLSATPGDTWQDYIPVFIANGFYKNRTEFNNKHVVFSRFAKYPKIERFVGIRELVQHRNDILIKMDSENSNDKVHEDILCNYDKKNYLAIVKNRWDIFENCPIQETGKLCYLMRKVVNSDSSRIIAISDILELHPTAIIFYNYEYELCILREYLDSINYLYSEWNGHKHEEVPIGDRWCYIVQYSAGAEGWNCITTDTIIFYSLNYSYRLSIQAEGRIDRLNTPFEKLYYYRLISKSPIDGAIDRALRMKQNFNERSFLRI